MSQHNEYEQSSLWKSAFGPKSDGLDAPRHKLADAYRAFRERVGLLLTHIQREIPDLTLHDITHVDALWRVASEIAGPDHLLNPAEAFVLGGAFLLHDAAHCRAAFPGGIAELRATPEWRDTVAQRGLVDAALTEGSKAFQQLLFDTLRVLHPKQARKLPFAQWPDGQGNTLHLLPHDELREAFGAVMGQVAESHWFSPHELEAFANNIVTAPACLSPASWTVNLLKVAVLLRVADAAHIDAKRAPRFLLALNQPTGVSLEHWRFQARLHQPHCDAARQALVLSSSPFPMAEQDAWWLAYDAACLADRELSAADHLLRDHGLDRLAAREVAGARSPESFARTVPTEGWHPVDASLRIGDVRSVVERFGGAQLYGDDPRLALRELLQNARDAVMASRALEMLEPHEGSITVQLEARDGEDWLHVTDTGIGMSRYVLTHVLLDFGRSLWQDAALRKEWPGLATAGFEAVGRFGIGFFSVFMLGTSVKVTTYRQQAETGTNASQWVLEFPQGLASRPSLRPPTDAERLTRPGTRVSVCLTDKERLLQIKTHYFQLRRGRHQRTMALSLGQVVGALVPALAVDVYTQEPGQPKIKTVAADDWQTIPPDRLLERIAPGSPLLFLSLATDDAAVARNNLSLITGPDGVVYGRCAVVEHSDSIFGVQTGVVTVKGIYGGPIDGLAGIVVGQQVDRLDRSASIPTVDGLALTQWAEDQANKLCVSNEVTWKRSARLLALGATSGELLVVKHGKDAWSANRLRSELNDRSEIWVLDEEGCSHDPDEDNVRRSEFHDYLELNDHVFSVIVGTPINGFIRDAGVGVDAASDHWPWSLLGEGARRPDQIFEDVVNAAWPDCVLETGQEKVIGTVQGVDIVRHVDVIYKVPRGESAT
ncbi:HD domain-containing protein [Hydrogenophaga soli]